jgi:hypothetical protein
MPLDGGNAANAAQPGNWPKSRAIGTGFGTTIVPSGAGKSRKENKELRDIIEGNAKTINHRHREHRGSHRECNGVGTRITRMGTDERGMENGEGGRLNGIPYNLASIRDLKFVISDLFGIWGLRIEAGRGGIAIRIRRIACYWG